jgi:predicted Zn-dependent peptidase
LTRCLTTSKLFNITTKLKIKATKQTENFFIFTKKHIIAKTMKFRSYIQKITLPVLILFLFNAFAFAQNTNQPAPKQEKLLNGLKLLMWNQPNAEKATVKLRIHSGSAFDPKDKEGVMALLADILFPNEQIKEFFTDDLGGSLEVVSNHDYIQINATGANDQILTILETIAAAVTNPAITKENTAKMKNARLAMIKEQQKNINFVADQSARTRLFGSFPYGRAQSGTEASLAKIDFADLLFAQERFLSADNATLAVAGNFKNDLIFRAVRRYFGGWRKNERRVPATFAAPETPDETPFSVQNEHAENSQARYAIRGLARNDKDFYAAQILTGILQNRLRNQISGNSSNDVFVRHEARLLPGLIIFGYASPTVPAKTGNTVSQILANQVTAEEFSRAKNEFLNEFNRIDAAERWLDFETYKLGAVKDEIQNANSVTIADVNRVIERLKKEPVIAVSVVKAGETTGKSTEN